MAKIQDYQQRAAECLRLARGARSPTNKALQQATKVELILNLKAANALGITVPLPLLGRAGEVIE
jgi:ABC-type uncharacterized transport system substrate-binding protein